jgi:hypothetical protein
LVVLSVLMSALMLSALMLSAPSASAASGIVLKDGVVEVTGFVRVTLQGSFQPVTHLATGRQAAAIRKALGPLVSATPSVCMESPEGFSIGFLAHKGARHPTVLVTENDCPTPGVLSVTEDGKPVETLKESCALRAAVIAVLPRGRAEGTRGDSNSCPGE